MKIQMYIDGEKCDALLCLPFKKREKHPQRSVTSSTVAG